MHGYPDRVYVDQTGATVMEVTLGEYGNITLPRTLHDQIGARATSGNDYRDQLLDAYQETLNDEERVAFENRMTKVNEQILQQGARTNQERAAVGQGLVGPGTGAPSLESARRQGLVEQESGVAPTPQPSPHTGSGDDNLTLAGRNVVEGGNQPGDIHTPGAQIPPPEDTGSPGQAAAETPSPEAPAQSEPGNSGAGEPQSGQTADNQPHTGGVTINPE